MRVPLSKHRQDIQRQIKAMPPKEILALLNEAIKAYYVILNESVSEANGFTLAAKAMSIGASEEMVYIIAKTFVASYEQRFGRSIKRRVRVEQ